MQTDAGGIRAHGVRASLAGRRQGRIEVAQVGVPVWDKVFSPELANVREAFDVAIEIRRTAVLAENTQRLVREAADADNDIDEMEIRHAKQ